MKQLLALAALTALSVPLIANVVTFSVSQPTNVSFQPDALVLTPREQAATQAVEICVRYRHDVTISAENTGPNPISVLGEVRSTQLVVRLGSDILDLGNTVNSFQRGFFLAAFDGTIDFDGASGASTVFPGQTGMIVLIVDDPAIVARLVGGERITIEMEASAMFSGASNWHAASTSDLQLEGMVEPLTRLLP